MKLTEDIKNFLKMHNVKTLTQWKIILLRIQKHIL